MRQKGRQESTISHDIYNKSNQLISKLIQCINIMQQRSQGVNLSIIAVGMYINI